MQRLLIDFPPGTVESLDIDDTKQECKIIEIKVPHGQASIIYNSRSHYVMASIDGHTFYDNRGTIPFSGKAIGAISRLLKKSLAPRIIVGILNRHAVILLGYMQDHLQDTITIEKGIQGVSRKDVHSIKVANSYGRLLSVIPRYKDKAIHFEVLENRNSPQLLVQVQTCIDAYLEHNHLEIKQDNEVGVRLEVVLV